LFPFEKKHPIPKKVRASREKIPKENIITSFKTMLNLFFVIAKIDTN